MARNNKHIKGDQAELIAQEYFIRKGFYVFKNISQHKETQNKTKSN